MDTKVKTDVGLSAGSPSRRNSRMIAWLVGTVVVLGMSVVALGAALIVESKGDEPVRTISTAPTPTIGVVERMQFPARVAMAVHAVGAHGSDLLQAHRPMVRRVDAFLAAYGSDGQALTSYWDHNATVWPTGGWVAVSLSGDLLRPTERTSRVVEVPGSYWGGLSTGDDTTVVAFEVSQTDEKGAGVAGVVWIQEWSTSDHEVLRMWAI